MHEGTQLGDRFVFFARVGKVVVVKAHDESRGAACLTRKAREVREVRDGAHLLSLRLDGLGKVPDAETRNVFRMVVLVDDDDREVVFHRWKQLRRKRRRPSADLLIGRSEKGSVLVEKSASAAGRDHGARACAKYIGNGLGLGKVTYIGRGFGRDCFGNGTARLSPLAQGKLS